jgi:hypothetical protein
MGPSALAVLRLITSSNLIGCRTRTSLGSATRSPTSRELSATFSRGVAEGPRRRRRKRKHGAPPLYEPKASVTRSSEPIVSSVLYRRA